MNKAEYLEARYVWRDGDIEIAEDLGDVGPRYSPEQPRVPAGAAAGGQFASAENAPPPDRPLGKGASGAQVKALQAALNRLGLKDKNGKPLKLDGKLGPLTTSAIKAAQAALGLSQTGKVTPALFKRLTAAKTLDDARKVKAAKKAPPLKGQGTAQGQSMAPRVAAVLADLGFRHLPGKHSQASHAGDRLNLAGRIELGPGESLLSSGKIEPKQETADVLYAVIDSPSGRQLRLGVIDPEGSSKWRAGDKGGTANFSGDQARTLRNELAQASDVAKRHAREADAEWSSGEGPDDPVLLGEDPVIEGKVRSAWGDLAYDVFLTDDEPTSWQTTLRVDQDDTVDGASLNPKELRVLLGVLDDFIEGGK